MVLRADANRQDVIFATNSRSENEVVTRGRNAWAVDGNEADWVQGYERYEQAMRASHEARLARFKAVS